MADQEAQRKASINEMEECPGYSCRLTMDAGTRLLKKLKVFGGTLCPTVDILRLI